MPPVGSPEAVARREHCNDWIEKTSGLIDDVGQTFVMRVGQVPLKGR